MKRKLVLAAFLIVLLAGCQMTPRQRFYSGLVSYKATAKLLVKARQDGVIESDVLWARILAIDSIVYRALMAYGESIEMGRPDEAAWEAFNAALDQLLEIYQRLPEPADKPKPEIPLFMEVARWQPKR